MGKIAVATAIAYPPRTNSITRSATYNAAKLPCGIRAAVAKYVSTKKLICPMPMPKNLRQHQPRNVAYPRMHERKSKLKLHALAHQRGNLYQKL